MAFEIKAIDNFITECKTSGKDITYDNFAPINESLSTDIQVPVEIFEAYLKYVDISGTDMVTILEFEKIKSFSEFINDRKQGDDSISTEDDDDSDSEGSEGDGESHEEPDGDEGIEGEGDQDGDEGEGEEAGENTGDENGSEGEGDAEGTEGEEGGSEGDGEGTEGEGENTDGEGTEGEEGGSEGEGDAEGEDKKKEGEDEEDPMGIKVESVQTPPEKVAAQASEKKDDESQQTKVDLATGDGTKTAASIEAEINKLGEPKKESEKEGEKLVGEGEVQTPPEKVAAQAAEAKDDESQQTKVDLATGDGSKTAGAIEDTINKLGEPEKKSETEGEKLVGESEEEKKTLK